MASLASELHLATFSSSTRKIAPTLKHQHASLRLARFDMLLLKRCTRRMLKKMGTFPSSICTNDDSDAFNGLLDCPSPFTYSIESETIYPSAFTAHYSKKFPSKAISASPLERPRAPFLPWMGKEMAPFSGSTFLGNGPPFLLRHLPYPPFWR